MSHPLHLPSVLLFCFGTMCCMTYSNCCYLACLIVAVCRRSLFRVFGGDRIKGLMSVFQIEDLPIESKMLTDALTEAQRKVESYFFGEFSDGT